MKSRIARLGVLAAAVVGLMATMTPPASATTVKVIAFGGQAQVPAGLGYPGIGEGGGVDTNKIPCTTNLAPDPGCVTVDPFGGPKGEPVVGFTPEGNHSAFNFSSAACVKATASDLKKAPGPQLCSIKASGAVWGYCGLSTGMGVATIDDTTPVTVLGPKQQQSTEIEFTGVGGFLYVTGGNTTKNIRALVIAVPLPSAPGGPSCTAKTATTFVLTGVAVFKDLNTVP